MDEPTPESPATAALPQINGFRLLRQLGRGGMSTVYLAEQTALGREVALKVMAPQALADEVSRRRFENEVRTIARLEHPNIVRIHELGRTRDGVPYYSMPHLARGHLGNRDFTGDEPGAVAIAAALLAALEYAHSRGVVHRDVKPENVLFDDASRPLLADFGIALRRGFGTRVTTAGLAVGSTAYMAPEQARGEEVDGRADLYALGVVLWEMLAGRLPYDAADALSMAIAHAQQPIPKLPAHLRHWQRFMYRALAKNPEQRFQNAVDMRDAMHAVRPPRWLPAWEHARHIAGGRPVRWAAGLALLAGLAYGAILFRPAGDVARPSAPPSAAAAAAVASAAVDPTDRMLAPPPGADVELAVTRARAQIARNALTMPRDDSALSTVLRAWHDSGEDPRVQALVVELSDAMRARIVTSIREGDDAKARDLVARNDELVRATGESARTQQSALRDDARKALRTRLEESLKRNDRKRAEQTIALARELRVAAPELARWSRETVLVQGKPRPAVGDEVADVGRGRVSTRAVTRAEYQRFADATSRPAALCRERASLLRVVAPRSWKAPGFAQSPSDAVVCVSMQDAEAYARWLGSQAGGTFRVPSATESSRTPPQSAGRATSYWLRDCGATCLQRMVSAGSWRGRRAQEALTANRGYDDVGFRLLRER